MHDNAINMLKKASFAVFFLTLNCSVSSNESTDLQLMVT